MTPPGSSGRRCFAASETVYRSDSLKSKPAKAATLSNITFATLGKPAAALKTTLDQAAATAHGMNLAKTSGQPAGQHLHADLSCRPGAISGQNTQVHQDHRAGRKGHAETGHGFIALGHARQRAAGQTDHAGIPRQQTRSKNPSCWSARASPSIPAASRSNPAPRWTK